MYELKNDDNDQSIRSTSEVEMPETSSKESTPPAPSVTTKYENKHFLNCLEQYKKFFVSFIKCKILPATDITDFFASLVYDKQQRSKDLQVLLDQRLSNEKHQFTPVDYSIKIQNNLKVPNITSDENSNYEPSMSIAAIILLDFCAFPNLLTDSSATKIPNWLVALVVVGCCKEASREIQLTAMNTLLEIFNMSRNQHYLTLHESGKNIITGILDYRHMYYVEENTLSIEVSTNSDDSKKLNKTRDLKKKYINI